MAKVEIEIPDGKIADITKNGDKVIVTFKEENLLDNLKDIESVIRYISKLRNSGVEWAHNLWKEHQATVEESYSEKICLYRMVVAALTNNEERSLTTGERYFPIVQFCKPGKERNCWGSEIIGAIESEGQKYTVVGGLATNSSDAGLGNFGSNRGVSYSGTTVGFRSVSSKEVAEHISKYFGRLLFDIHYGGTNCNWKWVN